MQVDANSTCFIKNIAKGVLHLHLIALIILLINIPSDNCIDTWVVLHSDANCDHVSIPVAALDPLDERVILTVVGQLEVRLFKVVDLIPQLGKRNGKHLLSRPENHAFCVQCDSFDFLLLLGLR